jgi:anti-sigma B factor antagonist
MTVNTENENDVVRLTLEGEVTIYTAHQTKQLLLDGLARAQTVEANLSGVTEFDSAGLQLLLLAHAEAVRSQKPFHIVGSSAAVDEVIRLCHLNTFFDSLQPPRIGSY